jgi:hypothetical protein
MRTLFRLVAAAALALALVPRPADAQVVRGELVERGTGRPIPGAMMVLLEGGARVRAAMTAQDGRFTLAAPGPGTYTLRADRVGFPSTVSAPLTLGPGEEHGFRMEADAGAITLSGITARAGRRCRVRPGVGEATAVLWEEARKAISAAAHQEGEPARFDLVVFARDLDAESGRVIRDDRRELSAQTRTPFASFTADTLSRRGFVRPVGDSVAYDAPDAHLLLSDRFLDEHCFRVEEDPARPGMVGLAFEPVRTRIVAEVAGVLWIDRASAELRSLEYRYVNVQRELADAGAGGTVELERLPGGRWIVSRWTIRMPQLLARSVATEIPARGVTRRRLGLPRTEYSVHSVREAGGIVVSSSVRKARTPGRVGRLAGVVWDSIAGAPLAGARVFLSGTRWTATTDTAGAFAIDEVPEGRYTAAFAHRVLVEWGAVPLTASVEVRAGAEARAELGVPSRATIAASRCTPEERRTMETERRGVVSGVVTRDGRPAPGATVRFTWPAMDRRARQVELLFVQVETDADGKFTACAVPTGVQLTLRVRGPGLALEQKLITRDVWTRHDVHAGAPSTEPTR